MLRGFSQPNIWLLGANSNNFYCFTTDNMVIKKHFKNILKLQTQKGGNIERLPKNKKKQKKRLLGNHKVYMMMMMMMLCIHTIKELTFSNYTITFFRSTFHHSSKIFWTIKTLFLRMSAKGLVTTIVAFHTLPLSRHKFSKATSFGTICWPLKVCCFSRWTRLTLRV